MKNYAGFTIRLKRLQRIYLLQSAITHNWTRIARIKLFKDAVKISDFGYVYSRFNCSAVLGCNHYDLSGTGGAMDIIYVLDDATKSIKNKS